MPRPGFDFTQRSEEIPWIRLRRKTDTTVDDPAWSANHYDPSALIANLGGTASDGDYEITIEPVDPAVADIDITFNRAAGETNAQILDGLLVEAQALSRVPGPAHSGDGELQEYLDYVKLREDGSSLLFLAVKDSAPPFTVSMSAPGTGTLAPLPVDTWPICRTWSPYPKRQGTSNPTQIELIPVMVDSSGDPLPNGTATIDIRPVNVIERRLVTDDAQTQRRVLCGGAVETTGHPMGQPLRVPFNGGQFGVEISAVTNPHGSIVAVEVWAREVVE